MYMTFGAMAYVLVSLYVSTMLYFAAPSDDIPEWKYVFAGLLWPGICILACWYYTKKQTAQWFR